MKLTLQKSRIGWIDVARAVTMFCVVLAHILPPCNIRTFLYSFHVPAFFFLSGTVFSSRDSFSKTLIKRFKSIMIPYYFFGLIAIIAFLTLSRFIVSYELNPFWDYLHGLIYGSVKTGKMHFNYHLWFLPVLFSMNIIFYPVHKLAVFISKKKRVARFPVMIAVTLLTFALSQLIFNFRTDEHLPLGIDTAVRLLPFFAAGCTASEVSAFLSPQKLSRKKKSVYIASSLILFIITAVLSKLNELKSSPLFHVNYTRDSYGNRFLFLSAAILGITAVILLSKALPAVKPLTYTGKKSLAVLVIQKFPITLFNSVIPVTSALIGKSDIFHCIILSVLTIIICLAANAVIEKAFPFVYGKPYKIKSPDTK